jgi:signal transduction histidine kinase
MVDATTVRSPAARGALAGNAVLRNSHGRPDRRRVRKVSRHYLLEPRQLQLHDLATACQQQVVGRSPPDGRFFTAGVASPEGSAGVRIWARWPAGRGWRADERKERTAVENEPPVPQSTSELEEWSTRNMPERGVVYAVGGEVTDWRRADAELQEAHRMVEASRAELAASRTRIVAAADEERRRVVRDLHDGAQARLVHTTITLAGTASLIRAR